MESRDVRGSREISLDPPTPVVSDATSVNKIPLSKRKEVTEDAEVIEEVNEKPARFPTKTPASVARDATSVNKLPSSRRSSQPEKGKDVSVSDLNILADPPPEIAQDVTKVNKIPFSKSSQPSETSEPREEPKPIPEPSTLKSVKASPPAARTFGAGDVKENRFGNLVYVSPNNDSQHILKDIQEIIPPDMNIDEYEESVLQKKSFPNQAKKPDKRLTSLRIKSLPSFRALINEAEEMGLRVRIRETKRPQIRQEWLFQQGRVRGGPKVTWTLTSNHRDGKAVDFLVNGDWTGSDEGYRVLWDLATRFGLDFIGPSDPGHIFDPN